MTDPKIRRETIGQAIDLVTTLLDGRRELGAVLANAVRREIPGFSPQSLGYPTFGRLLMANADHLVVVGQSGQDFVWALGADLSERELDQALGAGPEPGVEPPDPVDDRLQTFHLLNFRSCRDVTLRLDPLTVMVGPNGSGKSSLLFGLSYATQLTHCRVRALFSGPRDLRRLRTGNSTGPVGLSLVSEKGSSAELLGTPGEEGTQFSVAVHQGETHKIWRSPGDPSPFEGMAAATIFSPAVFLRLRAEALAQPSDLAEAGDRPRLDFDGYRLPSVLAHLANTDPERLEKVVEGVRSLVPDVMRTRQRLRRRERRERSGEDGAGVSSGADFQYLLDVELKGVGWVPADLLSEGTLFAFGLHTVMNQADPPRILLMDDIDRGLHPKAQRTLIRQIKQLSETGGPLIVVSTHSPYVLDEVSPSSVRVIRSTTSGTVVRPLTAHPEWAEWEGNMTAGEFWTYVGEDWLEQASEPHA